MNAVNARDRLLVRDEQRRAALPRPRGDGEAAGQDGVSRSLVILYTAGLLLFGLSIAGAPTDLHPQLLTSLAILLFAVALRAAGGAATHPERIQG